MDPTEKKRLLKQFENYLDEPDPELEPIFDSLDSTPETDFFSLFVELAALKNEVKIESRQFKEAFDLFRTVIDPLKSGYDAMQASLIDQRVLLESARKDTLRPLLLELLELRDRMLVGETMSMQTESSFLSRFCKQEQGLLTSMRQGVAMSNRRLEHILAAYQVKPFISIGKKLDPLRMRAMETISDPDSPHGQVTGELRVGYLWDENLLRPAEVIVNKQPTRDES